MGVSPIIKTMDEMLAKLKDAIQTRTDADKQITEYTNAIRALAKVVEDDEMGAAYLISLDEAIGKPGFMDAVRFVLRGRTLTPTEIRTWIIVTKKMDLSGYSNVMASIHSTLRRLKANGEIEETNNGKGEKAYCFWGQHSPATGDPVISPPAQESLAAKDARGELVGPKTKDLQAIRERFKAQTDKRRLRTL
jgi:hypothetical protein